MHHLTDRVAHTTIFVTSGVEHWLEREIAHLESYLILNGHTVKIDEVCVSD